MKTKTRIPYSLKVYMLSAIETLNSVCDGAKRRDSKGFNSHDAKFMKIIIAKRKYGTRIKRLDWESVMHRLPKYTDQLNRMGFDTGILQEMRAGTYKPKFTPMTEEEKMAYYNDMERDAYELSLIEERNENERFSIYKMYSK